MNPVIFVKAIKDGIKFSTKWVLSWFCVNSGTVRQTKWNEQRLCLMISKNASDWGVKLWPGLNDQSIWLYVSKGSSSNKETKQSTKFSDRSDLFDFCSFSHAWYSLLVKGLVEEKEVPKWNTFFNASRWVFRNLGLCGLSVLLDGVAKRYWFLPSVACSSHYIIYLKE